ncbi:hypothetical protein ACNJS9_02495 [Mycobacterium tuberculosis]
MAAALSLGCGVAAADPGYVANVIPCEQRTLVLSAFPAEADAVLAHTALDANPVVVADRRRYYLGSISGKKVIVAMTGIGLVTLPTPPRPPSHALPVLLPLPLPP